MIDMRKTNIVIMGTKRDNIESLLKHTDLTKNEKNFLQHELELLNKKSIYKSKTDVKKKQADEELQTEIFNALVSEGKAMTCSTISTVLTNSVGKQVSSQKIRSMLGELIKKQLVENYKEKNVSLFRAVE